MIVILAAAVAIAFAGAWLRWAVIPMMIAYDLGRRAERLCAQLRGRADLRSAMQARGGGR